MGFWGGPIKGYTTNLIQGSYGLLQSYGPLLVIDCMMAANTQRYQKGTKNFGNYP